MKALFFAFTCAVLLFSTTHEILAQTCRYTYPISLDCPDVSGDTVVLGRVVQLTDIDIETGKLSESKDLGGYPNGKVVVAVEDVLKGSADTFIEFTVHHTCYGPIREGSKHIFNLNKTPNGYTNPKWSNTIDYLTPSERDNFLNAHRVLIRGERLATLFGTLRDKESLKPVDGITVVAEKDGEKFEALTDANGRYDFGELPEGDYKVHPVLAPALRPAEHGDMRHAKPGDTARIRRDAPCGVRFDFFALHNGVISGHIEDADGKPIHSSAATLWRLDKNSKTPFRQSVPQSEYGPFAFVDLPPGRYLIEVVMLNSRGPWPSFYYPGVANEKEAVIIELTRGQELSGLVFKLPPH